MTETTETPSSEFVRQPITAADRETILALLDDNGGDNMTREDRAIVVAYQKIIRERLEAGESLLSVHQQLAEMNQNKITDAQ